MPIYMRIDASGRSAGGATGGVWKTTNFLTTDPANTVRLSSIAMSGGVGGVDERDAFATIKASELFEAARRLGPTGKLYVATNTGVFSKVDPMGRLVFGSDQGVWSIVNNRGRLLVGVDKTRLPKSGVGALESVSGSNTWNARTVEIFVCDSGRENGRAFKLWDVRASTSGRGSMVLSTSRIDF